MALALNRPQDASSITTVTVKYKPEQFCAKLCSQKTTPTCWEVLLGAPLDPWLLIEFERTQLGRWEEPNVQDQVLPWLNMFKIVHTCKHSYIVNTYIVQLCLTMYSVDCTRAPPSVAIVGSRIIGTTVTWIAFHITFKTKRCRCRTRGYLWIYVEAQDLFYLSFLKPPVNSPFSTNERLRM